MDWKTIKLLKKQGYGFANTVGTNAANGITVKMNNTPQEIFKQPVNGVFTSMVLSFAGSLDCPNITFTLEDDENPAVSLNTNISIMQNIAGGSEAGTPFVSNYNDVLKYYQLIWSPASGIDAGVVKLTVTPPNPTLDTATTCIFNYALFYTELDTVLKNYYPSSLKSDLNTIISLLQGKK